MRPEKKYLVQEVAQHLQKSEYVFVADYTGITVDETKELRSGLSELGAEFHVVKNSALRVAVNEGSTALGNDCLVGPTAIVTGGTDASGTAKVLRKFFKDKDKVSVKAGVMGDRQLTAKEVSALADLPNLETLQAKFLSLLNTPATQFVSLLGTPARQFATVLQAKADKGE